VTSSWSLFIQLSRWRTAQYTPHNIHNGKMAQYTQHNIHNGKMAHGPIHTTQHSQRQDGAIHTTQHSQRQVLSFPLITTFTLKGETSLCYFISKTVRIFWRTLYLAKAQYMINSRPVASKATLMIPDNFLRIWN